MYSGGMSSRLSGPSSAYNRARSKPSGNHGNAAINKRMSNPSVVSNAIMNSKARLSMGNVRLQSTTSALIQSNNPELLRVITMLNRTNNNMANKRLRLNISGKQYEVFEYMLAYYPNTLLGSNSDRIKYYDPLRDEYFFDRSREAFEGILHFYQSHGKFEVPFFIPVDVFYEELKFFKLVSFLNADCRCDEALLIIALRDQLEEVNEKYPNRAVDVQERRKFHHEKKRIKAKFKGLRYVVDDGDEETYSDEEDIRNKIVPANKYQKRLWLIMERPGTSILGKCVAFFCLITVITSVVIMCLETMEENKSNSTMIVQSKFSSNHRYTSSSSTVNEDYETMERKIEYFLLELVCNLIFTIEITLRLIASPDRKKFLKGFPNIIDIIAILPFWTALLMNNLNSTSNFRIFNFATVRVSTVTSRTPLATTSDLSESSFSLATTTATTALSSLISSTTKRPQNQYGLSVLRILRLTRVLRVLKLSRHIRALNIMGKILYECMYEIVLLVTFLGINIVIFSSFIYYIELQALGDASPFLSIPHSFWWAVISFTTIGYGDLIPHSAAGKLFGSFFIVCGILIALLPVPILSCKFEKIYKEFSQEIIRKDRRKKGSVNSSQNK